MRDYLKLFFWFLLYVFLKLGDNFIRVRERESNREDKLWILTVEVSKQGPGGRTVSEEAQSAWETMPDVGQHWKEKDKEKTEIPDLAEKQHNSKN